MLLSSLRFVCLAINFRSTAVFLGSFRNAVAIVVSAVNARIDIGPFANKGTRSDSCNRLLSELEPAGDNLPDEEPGPGERSC